MGYRSYSYDDYIRAMKMIEKLGVTETSRRLGISKPTLYRWKNGEHIPPLAKWHPEPSKELVYVLGVLHGDGNVCIEEHHYRIQLGVKDLEFAEAFSKNMAETLNKKYSTPRWYESRNRWRVEYNSKAFYVWYEEQTLETLKSYIEHNKETVANFLRGLYDSDGGHYKYKSNNRRYSKICLSNNNIELLKYVQYLLKRHFGIIARGPYLNNKARTKSKIKNGKTISRNHDNYRIDIDRKQHTQVFLNEIGFNIKEKQLGLPRRK